MNTFSNIKELLSALARERVLLTEMFEKRKTFSYKYDYALELVEGDDNRIRFLIDRSVIRENGSFLEIDDQFLQFFEQILEVNEEINISLIDSNIRYLKDNINYFLKENNEHRRYNYLRTIKSALRKMGSLTLRNVVDLKRNVDNTFKNEPNYKVKKAKLETLDRKRNDLALFMLSIEDLMNEEEQTFFKIALDDELLLIIHYLKVQLNECRHNIIAVQKQIIEYLNQIQYQSRIVEKLRQLKYLKDQFTIRNDTDLECVLVANHCLVFEKRTHYPLKLSLDYLSNDDVLESIRKANTKLHSKAKQRVSLAPALPLGFLKEETETELQINLEEVKNSFIASGNNLFSFVMQYPYEKELEFDERVTLFCQLISLYEEEFEFTTEFSTLNEIEYAIVYPK